MPLSQKLLEEENWVTRQWMPHGNVDYVNGISAAKEVRLKRFETGVTEPPTWQTSLFWNAAGGLWDNTAYCLFMAACYYPSISRSSIWARSKQWVQSQERAVTINWLTTKGQRIRSLRARDISFLCFTDQLLCELNWRCICAESRQ